MNITVHTTHRFAMDENGNDIRPTCKHCGRKYNLAYKGRMPVYCSRKCRVAAFRQRREERWAAARTDTWQEAVAKSTGDDDFGFVTMGGEK